MDANRLQQFVDRTWNADVSPALFDYIAIPCESPAFDSSWETSGHMGRAVDLMMKWAQQRLGGIPGVKLEVLRLEHRTPIIFIDIPGEAETPVLIYGHLDKQPPMAGWAPGLDPWEPTMRGDRLYGRGGADDGYAIFSAITAILGVREQGLVHSRCMILIEASEESGSPDLSHYMDLLSKSVGEPAIVIALDAGCGNYDQLWMTTSLRGQVAGTLTVRVLNEGVHSGDASGVVPSSFRIARQLISRLESADTGDIAAEFHVGIPIERQEQARDAGAALGASFHGQLPFCGRTKPVSDDVVELMLNRAWRPQLAITGADGLPSVANAAAVMHPATALKLSLRLPPTLDAEVASQRMRIILESAPPYGCEVSFQIDMVSKGWHAPTVAPWLASIIEEASSSAFGGSTALMGGGGGIPFVPMLSERYSSAQFIVTGVLGPESNAHGPNEFLHVPTAKRITVAVAHLLHKACFRTKAGSAVGDGAQKFDATVVS